MIGKLRGFTKKYIGKIPVVGQIANMGVSHLNRVKRTFTNRFDLVDKLPWKPAPLKAALTPYTALRKAISAGNTFANTMGGVPAATAANIPMATAANVPIEAGIPMATAVNVPMATEAQPMVCYYYATDGNYYPFTNLQKYGPRVGGKRNRTRRRRN